MSKLFPFFSFFLTLRETGPDYRPRLFQAATAHTHTLDQLNLLICRDHFNLAEFSVPSLLLAFFTGVTLSREVIPVSF